MDVEELRAWQADIVARTNELIEACEASGRRAAGRGDLAEAAEYQRILLDARQTRDRVRRELARPGSGGDLDGQIEAAN